MSFIESIKTCLTKYAVFGGRARRSEYWWFYLANMILSWVLFYGILGTGYTKELTSTDPDLSEYSGRLAIALLISLALLLPSLAVAVRRLHDTGKSGAYIFIALIPLAGPIILLVALVTEGTPGANEYGPSPK